MAKTRAPRLLFADEQGVVYDHPGLVAGVRSGDDVLVPAGKPIPLPDGGSLNVLPGRRPVGYDPKTGERVVVRRVEVDGREVVPNAVAAALPPGFTRTYLPAFEKSALAPALTQWAYTAAALGPGGKPAVYALHTDKRTHWDPKAHSTADLKKRVEKRLARERNPLYRQIARCALEYRCFTAQNTFYARDEGAIPASASCNAKCAGCISEQNPGLPPPSHERQKRPPTPEEMADLGATHLDKAKGRVMVTFGQGCEGEPLMRWREIEKAIRLMRVKTRKGSINMNTNGSLPRALAALAEAGLDACRVSLNSARGELYTAYYRPVGYTFGDVVASMRVAKDKGVYLALNLLTFPGVTDREPEVEALCRLVREVGVDQVQTRSLAMDPDAYMQVARPHVAGPSLGVERLVEELKRARPGLVIGNFAQALDERAA